MIIMKKKVVALVIIGCLGLNACGSQTITNPNRDLTHSDSFTALNKDDFASENTGGTENNGEYTTAEPVKTIDDMYVYTPGINEPPTPSQEEETYDVEEPVEDDRVTTINSTIPVDSEAVSSIVIEDCSWFSTDDIAIASYYESYQYVVYCIDQYYGGNVPCNFTCNMWDDSESISDGILVIKVHGDGVELQITIDNSTSNTTVEEL